MRRCRYSQKSGVSSPYVRQLAAPGESHHTASNSALLSLCNTSRVQSMRWCDEGIYLLASQPVDKCQSQDGAEAALQEIEKFLETGAENKIQELNKIYQDYEPILTKDLMVGHPGLLARSSPVLNGASYHDDVRKDHLRTLKGCWPFERDVELGVWGGHLTQLPGQYRSYFHPPSNLCS